MKYRRGRISGSVPRELVTLVIVLAVCLCLTVYLGVSAPTEKRMGDYLAQGVFSALFALPTGVAWRLFRQAARNRR
jgi:hypothetical protein